MKRTCPHCGKEGDPAPVTMLPDGRPVVVEARIEPPPDFLARNIGKH